MQDTEYFNSMPASLAAKAQAYAKQTAAKAYNICKRNHVPQDVAEVFILDAIDILRAQFRGLRATTEQMQMLTAAVQQRSWDKTENALLCFMAQYYAQIAAAIRGREKALSAAFVNAVIVYEVATRTAPDYLIACDTAEQWTEAQRLYYAYAVLIAAEWCNATEAELRGIEPYGGITIEDKATARAITTGLDMQKQRQQMQAAKQKPPKQEDSGTLYNCGTLLIEPYNSDKQQDTPDIPQPREKTIYQYQNLAYMIGNGLQTADDTPGGKLRPLWQSLAEQQQAAKKIMEDDTATDEDKARAAVLAADTYAVSQAMDFIQVLPQVEKPISGNTRYSGYMTTPREAYRIATGIENPNSEQIRHFLRGLAFIDTQRISVAEETQKKVVKRDDSGAIMRDENGRIQREWKKRTIVTDFRPVVVTFRTEYEDNAPIEKATRLYLDISNLLKDGRSSKYIQQDGKRVEIIKTRQNYMKIGQYYNFTAEDERIFRSIILSKPQQAEDTMLSAVFNYPKRQAEADRKAAEAQKIADAMQSNPKATDDEKQQTQAAADAAKEYARYCITNDMGRDYNRLAGMFEKAQDCGLITAYNRRTAATGGVRKQNKYGRGYVWEWERPEDKEHKRRNKAK